MLRYAGYHGQQMTATASVTEAVDAGRAREPRLISEAEALKLYVRHLKSQTWCIDTSGATTMAFHAESGAQSNLDTFRLEFPEWALKTGVRVQSDDYARLLDGLKVRVPPRLPRILGNTFRPTPEPFVDMNGATFANIYVPYNPVRPADSSVALAEELLARLFKNQEEHRLVLQWMAHLIQRPAERPQFGLLITGEGGEGKSLVMQLLESALGGNHWWRERDFGAITRRFSEVLPDNLLVCLDDAKLPPDAAEHLKHPITARYQQVEVKGKQGTVKREVYSRIAILSNRMRPLRMDEERRWFCPARCKNPVDRAESREFGARVATWLCTPGTSAAIYHWLMNVDLAGFDPGGCPETETYHLMADASESQLDRYLADFLNDREGQPIFHEKTLVQHLANEGVRNPNLDVLKLKLADLGYDNSKRRKIAGKDVRLWQPTATRGRSLTEDELLAIREAAGLPDGF